MVYMILSILALAGGAGVLYGTQPGIGLYPDSVIYIAAARSLLAGKGIATFGSDGNWVPLTHFPPLFPLLLSLSHIWGQDPINGARWISAVSFAATIFLTGFVLKRFLPRSFWPPILGGALVAGSAVLLPVFLVCYSEAIFIPLVLAGAYFLVRFLEGRGKGSFLRSQAWRMILFSACLSLALLTRYAGAAFILAAGACLWAFYRGAKKEKLKALLAFAGVGGLPTAAWLARNLALAGDGTDRLLAFHLPGWKQIDQMGQTLASWLVPSASGMLYADLVGWVLAALFVCGVGFYWWKTRSLVVSVLGIFILVYLLFLAVSMTLFDSLTLLDERILSPVYLPAAIMIIVIGSAFWERFKHKLLPRIFLPTVLFTFLVVNAFGGLTLIVLSHQFGWGYTNISWRESKLMGSIKEIPQDELVITNDPGGVYILTGRIVPQLPMKVNPTTLIANPGYQERLDSLGATLEKKGGWVAWFDETTWYIPNIDELEKEWPLRLAADTGDGRLYQAAPAISQLVGSP